MEENNVTVKEIDGKFLVGKKVFYTKPAAIKYIEELSSEKAAMSTGTKIFIAILIGIMIVFILSIGSGSFNRGRLIDVAIKGALVGGVFGVLIEPIAWLKRKITSYFKNATTNKSIDKVAYAEALQELEDGAIIKNTWAKAFSQAEGDENKAKAIYIKLRVLDMKK